MMMGMMKMMDDDDRKVMLVTDVNDELVMVMLIEN